MKPLKLRFLSEAEAAKVETVPVYRIRHGGRKFMGWAQRDDALLGAVEIRFVGDETGGNGAEVVYAQSDA